MDAVISGRAGVALLLDGERLLSLHADRPGEVIQRHDGDVRWLLGEAKDLEFLEDVDPSHVAQYLDLANTKADALHLALILLDAGLSHDTRRSAAEELDDLLEDERVVRWVESVLFAHPLPRSADLVGARSACTGRTERTREFLRKLESLQPVIVEVQQAWEAIPSRLFATEEDRKHALSVAMKEGLFRDFVIKRAAGERVDHFLLNLSNSALQEILDAQQVVKEWVADFREPGTVAWKGGADFLRVQNSLYTALAAYDSLVSDRGRGTHRSGRLAGAVRLPPHLEEAGRGGIFPLPEGIDGDTGLPVPFSGMAEVARLLAERHLGSSRGIT